MPSLTDLLSYLMSKGWSKEQSAGILGNGLAESGLNPSNTSGDGGLAHGAFQWHPDRQANFLSKFGIPIAKANIYQQLDFVDWELRNTEKSAGDALSRTSSAADAAQVFMAKYERPKDNSSLNTRIKYANEIYGGSPSSILEQAMQGVQMGIDNSGVFGIPTNLLGTSDFWSWLKDNASNVIAGAVGVSIIIFGIYWSIRQPAQSAANIVSGGILKKVA